MARLLIDHLGVGVHEFSGAEMFLVTFAAVLMFLSIMTMIVFVCLDDPADSDSTQRDQQRRKKQGISYSSSVNQPVPYIPDVDSPHHHKGSHDASHNQHVHDASHMPHATHHVDHASHVSHVHTSHHM